MFKCWRRTPRWVSWWDHSGPGDSYKARADGLYPWTTQRCWWLLENLITMSERFLLERRAFDGVMIWWQTFLSLQKVRWKKRLRWCAYGCRHRFDSIVFGCVVVEPSRICRMCFNFDGSLTFLWTFPVVVLIDSRSRNCQASRTVLRHRRIKYENKYARNAHFDRRHESNPKPRREESPWPRFFSLQKICMANWPFNCFIPSLRTCSLRRIPSLFLGTRRRGWFATSRPPQTHTGEKFEIQRSRKNLDGDSWMTTNGHCFCDAEELKRTLGLRRDRRHSISSKLLQ